MERIVADGIPVLIPPDSSRRKAPGRAGTAASTSSCAASWPPSAAASSTDSANSSSSRSSANTKHNRGFNRFHRRGRAAVRTEWRLIAATHNLLKLHRHAPRRSPEAADRRPRATPRRTDRRHGAPPDLRDSLACKQHAPR